MHKLKLTSSGIFFLLFFSLLNWNCTKIDTTDIGSGLIPVVDNVHTFDTSLAVIANNFDLVDTDCAKIYPAEQHILGVINNDPYFGTTKGTIYTQLAPLSFPYDFPAIHSLDSIVLVLSYTGTYGDSTIPQKVNVYPILNTFKPDSSSCTAYPFDNSNLLGSAIYQPQRLTDSVIGFNERSSNQLRIKLSTAFGQSILAQGGTTGLLSDSLFKIFFKGFAIVPDEPFGGNAVTFYNLADSNTKLAIYFHYNAGLTNDTVVNFRLTNLTHTANNIVRNHSGAEITQHTSHPAAGDSLIYIQTIPGTFAEIKIPDLSSLSNRIINKAELIVDQVYSSALTDKYFYTPDFLFLDLKDTAAGNFRPIPCDFNTLSGSPNLTLFGGFRTFVNDPFGNRIARYSFNLSRYVQKIVTSHRINSTLRLKAPDAITIPTTYVDECNQPVAPLTYPINVLSLGRVKLGGGNNSSYRMRLHIVFTKL
ncbi:MAG: DUF4270 family protein [Chitinophagaceae bacterium]|nr:DUF4270 family protein [Chitinophagaceae bacterium]